MDHVFPAERRRYTVGHLPNCGQKEPACSTVFDCQWQGDRTGFEHRYRKVQRRYPEASMEMAATCMGTYWAFVKFPLSTPWRCMWEQSYSSTHSEPRHWMEVNGELHDPAALPPLKNLGTHKIWGWVGQRSVLERRKLSCSYRFSNPGPPSP